MLALRDKCLARIVEVEIEAPVCELHGLRKTVSYLALNLGAAQVESRVRFLLGTPAKNSQFSSASSSRRFGTLIANYWQSP
jgi:hypothetical protein